MALVIAGERAKENARLWKGGEGKAGRLGSVVDTSNEVSGGGAHFRNFIAAG